MSPGSVLLIMCGIFILICGFFIIYLSMSGGTEGGIFALLLMGGGVCIAASIVTFKEAFRRDANLIYP
jgi:hypothetical protein